MTAQLKGKHVFIMEDNSSNRLIYQVIMTRHNMTITFDRYAKNTLEILELSDPVDLIILDLMMGTGSSGFEIIQQIRARPGYAAIPVVAISASDPMLTIPYVQEYGFNGFIAKPINDDLFPDQLVRLLNGESLWYAGDRYGYLED